MAREEKILEQLDQLSRMTLGVDSDVDEGKLNQISSLLVDMDDNLREGVQGQSAAAMEAIIRECPDQYFWVHRRFKTRPPGEPPVY